jgi:hypothetical protein
MSDWNPLELRKWKPRPPSPELRARIFDARPQAGGAAAAIAFDFRELTRFIVPAFGCFLLVMASLSDHWHTRYAVDIESANLLATALADEAPLPPSTTKHSMMNSIPALEWNLGPRTAATSIGTIFVAYTNKLMR